VARFGSDALWLHVIDEFGAMRRRSQPVWSGHRGGDDIDVLISVAAGTARTR